MIFAFDLSVLPDAQSAQKQPQGLTDWEERDVEPVSVQTEKASDTRLLTGLAPKGWQVSENIERYTGDNLYEKINGRAEHYLAYDVISLTYIGFMDGAEGSRFLNVFGQRLRSRVSYIALPFAFCSALPLPKNPGPFW